MWVNAVVLNFWNNSNPKSVLITSFSCAHDRPMKAMEGTSLLFPQFNSTQALPGSESYIHQHVCHHHEVILLENRPLTQLSDWTTEHLNTWKPLGCVQWMGCFALVKPQRGFPVLEIFPFHCIEKEGVRTSLEKAAVAKDIVVGAGAFAHISDWLCKGKPHLKTQFSVTGIKGLCVPQRIDFAHSKMVGWVDELLPQIVHMLFNTSSSCISSSVSLAIHWLAWWNDNMDGCFWILTAWHRDCACNSWNKFACSPSSLWKIPLEDAWDAACTLQLLIGNHSFNLIDQEHCTSNICAAQNLKEFVALLLPCLLQGIMLPRRLAVEGPHGTILMCLHLCHVGSPCFLFLPHLLVQALEGLLLVRAAQAQEIQSRQGILLVEQNELEVTQLELLPLGKDCWQNLCIQLACQPIPLDLVIPVWLEGFLKMVVKVMHGLSHVPHLQFFATVTHVGCHCAILVAQSLASFHSLEDAVFPFPCNTSGPWSDFVPAVLMDCMP